MSGVSNRLLGLCPPAALFCALDGTLTLAGQSAEYWSGNYSAVNETSPTFNHVLQTHPAAFAAVLMAWIAVFVGMILLVTDTLALILSVAITFGHTAGAATWLLWRFQYGYQACNALFLASAIGLGLGIRHGWGAEPRQKYRLGTWSWRRRTLAAVFLTAIGVYLFLWPRSP